MMTKKNRRISARRKAALRRRRRVLAMVVSAIMMLAIAFVIGAQTFSWFDQEKSAVNSDLTLGELNVEITLYKYGFNGSVIDPALTSVQSGSYPNGIFDDTMTWQIGSHGVTYIKVENLGNIDARVYMNLFLNGSTTLTDYDYNYIYLYITDVTNSVNAVADNPAWTLGDDRDYKLESVATDYNATYNSDVSYYHSQIVSGGKTVGQYMEDKYQLSPSVIPQRVDATTPTVRYFRMDYCENNMPSAFLTALSDKSRTVSDFTATFFIKQGNYTENTATSSETFVVDSDTSFVEAVKIAQNGDTIILSNDVIFTKPVNITFYNRVNLDLNGYRLHILGNMAYDVVSFGSCYINLLDSSELIVNGDLIIDAPSTAFTINGTGNYGIRLGTYTGLHTTNGRFYAKTISDNKSGFTLSNIRIVKTQTDGNGTYLNNEMADLELGSNTALRVMSGTEIGNITAENKAYCISVENYGIIQSIDFSKMSYAGLGQDQININNCNRILATNPSITLPYWSRGHISAYDPLASNIDYDDLSEKDPVTAQVNTTVSRGAGSVDGMTVGVKFHFDPNSNSSLPANSFSSEEGYVYIAENRAEAKTYYATSVSPADIDFVNYIYFYNVDIKNDNSSAQNVIRVSANNYIVMLFGEAMPDSTPETLQLRLEEYFAGVGSAYAGEPIHSLTLRTYNTAKITAADFAYMNSSYMDKLVTLDLSAAVMDNGEIPASALEGRTTLANLTLPITVCTIGDYAFKDTSVHFVKVGDNVQAIGTDAFLTANRTSATAAYKGYTFITWTSGINIPTAVANGFNSDYNIIFMNRSLLSTFRTTNPAFELKSCEVYDGFLSNNFYKYTGVNSVRIVYYHGTAMNDMVPDSMMLDRNGTGTAEYYVTSVGDSAYRLSIYNLNNNTNKTEAEKFITLTFRNNLEDVGDYAFKDGRFSTLSLNKVKTLGIGTFQNAYIQKSLARPAGETLTGLGDYCFENAVIGYELNTDDVSTIGNAFYNNCVTVSPSGKFSYTIGNTTTFFDYNGGILDLSGNYSIPLHAFQNMKVFGTEFTIKGNQRLEKTKLSDTVEQGPFDGTMFYGCYIELNGLEMIKSDIFANKINTGYDSLQNYTFLNIRNVKQLNGNVFEGCNVNTVYIGIDSGKYVDQMHVDYLVDSASPTDRNCQYKSSNTKPVFYNAKIRNIDVSGWLPTETTDNEVGIFAAYINTTYENVRFHNMSSNRVPGNMFSSYDTYTLTIDNLDVDMTMDCYVGANCFKGSVLNNAVFVAPGKLIIETSAFEDADITAFTRYINPTRSQSDNRFSEVWANAFQNATFSHTPVEINLSACTRLEACAFNATEGIVGSVVVGPAVTSLKHDTFSSTKITSLELKGVTTINDTSAPGISPFENCKQLVVLKAPALVDLTPRLNGLTSLTELYLGTAGEDPGYMIGAATMFEVEPDITNFHIFVPDANYLSYFRTIMADKYKTSVVLAHNGVSAAGYAAGDNIADYTYNGVEIGHYVLSLNDDNVTYRVVGVNSAYSSTPVNNSTITYSPSGIYSTAPMFASDSALVVPDSVTLRNGGGNETVNGIEYGSVRYAKITTVTFDAGVKTFGYAGYHATFGTTVTFPNADYNVIAGNKMQTASLVFPDNSYIGQYAFYGCAMPNMVTLTVGPGSTIGKQAFSTCTMTNALTKTITLDGVLVIGDQAFANMNYGATPIDIHATDVGVIGAGALAIADRVGDVTLGVSGADDAAYCWGGTSGSDTDAGIFAYGTGTITVDSLTIVGKVPANSVNSALAGYYYNNAGTKLIYKAVDLSACTQLTPYAFYAGTTTKSYAYTEIQNTAALTIGCGAPDYSFYYCYFPTMTSLTVNGDVGTFAFNHASFTSLKQLSVSAGHTINDDAFSYSSWGATGTKSVNFDDCTYMGVRAMAALTVSNGLVDVSALNVGVIKAAALGSKNLGTVTLGVATDDSSYKWGGDYTLWQNDPTSGVFTYVEQGVTIVVDKLVIVGDVPTGISALAGHVETYKTLVEFNNVDLSACTKLNVQSFTSGGASYYRDQKTTIHNIISPVLNCDIGDSCFELCVIENVSSLTVSSGHTIGTKAFCDVVWNSAQDITITIDGCSSVGACAFYNITTSGSSISINALNVANIGAAAFASSFDTVKVGVADATSATWGGAYSLEGRWPDVQAGIFTRYYSGSILSINELIIVGATPDCESALAGGGGANTDSRYSLVSFGTVDLTNCTKIGASVFTSGTNSKETCTIIQNLVTTASGSSITCNIGAKAFAYCEINNFGIAVINGNIGDSAFYSASVNGVTDLTVNGNVGNYAFYLTGFDSLKSLSVASGHTVGAYSFCSSTWSAAAAKNVTVDNALSLGLCSFCNMTVKKGALNISALNVKTIAMAAFGSNLGTVKVGVQDKTGCSWGGTNRVSGNYVINNSINDTTCGIFTCLKNGTTVNIGTLEIIGSVPDFENVLAGSYEKDSYYTKVSFTVVDLTQCDYLPASAFTSGSNKTDKNTTIGTLTSTATGKTITCNIGDSCFAYCGITSFDIAEINGNIGNSAFYTSTVTATGSLTVNGDIGNNAFKSANVTTSGAVEITGDVGTSAFQSSTLNGVTTITISGNVGDSCFINANFYSLLNLRISGGHTVGKNAFYSTTWSASGEKYIDVHDCTSLDRFAFNLINASNGALNIDATGIGFMEPTSLGTDWNVVKVGYTGTHSDYVWGGSYAPDEHNYDISAGVFSFKRTSTKDTVTVNKLQVIGNIPNCSGCLTGCRAVGAYSYLVYNEIDLSACTQLGSYAFWSEDKLTIGKITASTSANTLGCSIATGCFKNNNIQRWDITTVNGTVGISAFESSTVVTTSNLYISGDVGTSAFRSSTLNGVTSISIDGNVGDSAFNSCVLDALTSLTVLANHSIGDNAFLSSTWNASTVKNITVDSCTSLGKCAFAALTVSGGSVSISAINIPTIGAAAFGSNFDTVQLGMTADGSYSWGSSYSLAGVTDSEAGIFASSVNKDTITIKTLIINGYVPTSKNALAGHYGNGSAYSLVLFNTVDISQCNKLPDDAFTSGASDSTLKTEIKNLYSSSGVVTCTIGDRCFRYCSIGGSGSLTFTGSVGSYAFQGCTIDGFTSWTMNANVLDYAFKECSFPAMTAFVVTGGHSVGDEAFTSSVWSANGKKDITVNDVTSIGIRALANLKISNGVVDVSALNIPKMGPACLGSNFGTVKVGIDSAHYSASATYEWGGSYSLINTSTAGIFAPYHQNFTSKICINKLEIIGTVPNCTYALAGFAHKNGEYRIVVFNTVDLTQCTKLNASVFTSGATSIANNTVINNLVSTASDKSITCDIGVSCFEYCTINMFDIAEINGNIGDTAFKSATVTGSGAVEITGTVGTSAFESATVKGVTDLTVVGDVGDTAFKSATVTATGNVTFAGSLGTDSFTSSKLTANTMTFTGTVGTTAFKSATLTATGAVTFNGTLNTNAFESAKVCGTAAMVVTKDIPNYCFKGFDLASTATLTLSSTCENIGDYAFKSAKLNGAFSADPVTLGTETFYGASFAVVGGSDQDTMSWNRLKTVGTTCFGLATLPKYVTMNALTEIATSAFYQCANMVVFTATSVTKTQTQNTFFSSSSLERVVIPNCTELVVNCFYNCTKLHELYVGHTVSVGNNVLSGVSNVTLYDCGSSVSSSSHSSVGATLTYCIDACTYNAARTIYTGNIDPYTLKGYDYYKYDDTCVLQIPRYVGYEDNSGNVTIVGCNSATLTGAVNLTTVKDKDEADHTVVAIGNNAFRYTKMTNVALTFGSSTTSIGNYAFYADTTYPKSITTASLSFPANTTIGNNAFRNCSFPSLTTLTIGSGSTVGDAAFYCATMNAATTKTITLTGVTSIGKSAFEAMTLGTGRTNIEAKEVGIIEAAAFGSSFGTVTVGVTTDDVSSYKWGGTYGSFNYVANDSGIFSSANNTSLVIDRLEIEGSVPSMSDKALGGYGSAWNCKNWITFHTVDLTNCTQLCKNAFYQTVGQNQYFSANISIGTLTTTSKTISIAIPSECFRYVTIGNLDITTFSGTVGASAFANTTINSIASLTISGTTGTSAFANTTINSIASLTISGTTGTSAFANATFTFTGTTPELTVTGTLGDSTFNAATLNNLTKITVGAGKTVGASAFASALIPNVTQIDVGTNATLNASAFNGATFGSLTNLTIGSGSTVGEKAFYATDWKAATDKTITVTDCASLGKQAFCGMTHTDGEITVLATGIRTMGPASLGSDFKSVTVGLSNLDGTEAWGGSYTIGGTDTTTGVFAASKGSGKVSIGTLTVSGKIPDCTSCLAGYWWATNNPNDYSKVEICNLDLSGCTHLGTGCFSAGTNSASNSNTYSAMVIDITDGLSINLDIPANCFSGVVFRGDSTVTTAGANTISVANGKSIGNDAFRYCYHDVTKAISLGDNVTVGTYAFANSVYNSLKEFDIGDTATVGNYALYYNTFSSALTLAIGDTATVGDYAISENTFSYATTINIGNRCNAGVYVFQKNTSPVSLTMNIGYGGVIGIYMFYASKLNNVNMKFNTVPVGETATTVDQYGFKNAVYYTNSTWIISDLVNVSDHFFEGVNGTSLSIYCFGTVTIGGNAFNSISGTVQAYFDSALTTFNGGNTFNNANGLKKFIMTSLVPPSGSPFANLHANVMFYVPLNLLNTYKTTAQWSSVASRIFPIENDIDGWKYKILSGDDTSGYDISVSGYYGSDAIANGVLTIPASLTKGVITYRIVQLDDGLLDGGLCTTITSIRIPASVYSIDVKLFDEDVTANAIQTVQVAVGSSYYRAGITIVDGYSVGPLLESANGTVLYRVMGDYYEANGISSITLDYSVIYAGALNYATAIEDVTFGTSLSYIPDKLFNTGTTNVKRITFTTQTPPFVFGNAAFGDIVIVGVVGTETVYQVGNQCAIYVPAGDEGTYKTSIGFVRYALAIQAAPTP